MFIFAIAFDDGKANLEKVADVFQRCINETPSTESYVSYWDWSANTNPSKKNHSKGKGPLYPLSLTIMHSKYSTQKPQEKERGERQNKHAILNKLAPLTV